MARTAASGIVTLMDPAQRRVTQLPLQELWRLDGTVTHSRMNPLESEDIAELLRAGVVEFVVADVGLPLHWIPLNECFDFWKTEAKQHLAAPNSRLPLNAYFGGYAYFATRWKATNGNAPIVLLERSH